MNNLWIVLCLNRGQSQYSEHLFATLHSSDKRTIRYSFSVNLAH
jgi:hypothetical protein